MRSVGETHRPYLGLLVRHELLTLELLAPHLAWLEVRDRELAGALRYVFAYLATPPITRRVPEYFVAELVATLDQWSAAAYSQRDLTHLVHAPRPLARPAHEDPARSAPTAAQHRQPRSASNTTPQRATVGPLPP